MTAEEKVNEAVESIKKPRKSSKKEEEKQIISTGSTLIDLVLGGGLPIGFTNVIGDSQSMKSALCGEIIAASYHLFGKDGFDWFYDDAEDGYKFDSKKLYLIDIKNDGYFPASRRSNTIEDFEFNLREIIKKKDKNKPFVYVLDSFDSITTDDELEYRETLMKAKEKDKDAKKGTYNLAKQKSGHAFFRTKVREMVDNNIYLIIISQTKDKIDAMFGPKKYRVGGSALDFYANVHFWLAEVQKYEKISGRPHGICCKIKGTKTRNPNPFRECLVDFIFDRGMDNVTSNINFLYDLKTVGTNKDKKNLECEWDGAVYERDDLVKYIEDNNLEKELEKRTIDRWNEIEAEVSSAGRKPRWNN